jgi:hypothetical protein
VRVDGGDLVRARELAEIAEVLPFSDYVPSIPPALALFAVREGRLDDAVNIAVDVLARSGDGGPCSAELLMIAADTLLMSHHPEMALDLLDRYRARANEGATGPDLRRARVLFELGRSAES